MTRLMQTWYVFWTTQQSMNPVHAVETHWSPVNCACNAFGKFCIYSASHSGPISIKPLMFKANLPILLKGFSHIKIYWIAILANKRIL